MYIYINHLVNINQIYLNYFFSFLLVLCRFSDTSAVQGDGLVATRICGALTLCDNPRDVLSSSAG